MKTNKKGFTLIEVSIVLGLIGIIISLGYTLFNFGNKSHSMSIDEYQIQSEMRVASTKLNNYLRYSTAIFTLPELKIDKLTEGWNYLALSEDNKEIIEYIYDSNTKKHTRNVIVSGQEKLSYNLEFKKENPYHVDKLLKFTLEGLIDGNGNKKIVIESEVEALNALQVIDRGSNKNISKVLAYRDDERPLAAEAAIAMVLDKSGSMAWTMNGSTTSNVNNHRTAILRREANKLIENFSEMQNVYLSLIPFATSGNFPTPYDNSRDFFNVYEKKTELQSRITGQNKSTDFLHPEGGTNTGDGMRRAYYKIKEFNNDPNKKDVDIKNYMVILVDGVTTFASVNSSRDRSYKTNDGNINEGYLDRNPKSSEGQIAGNGSTIDSKGTGYVNEIGKIIKNSNIKVYVIGFSSKASDLSSVNDIATACGAVKSYEAGNEEDLAKIFEEIRQDILRDLWHISGPQ